MAHWHEQKLRKLALAKILSVFVAGLGVIAFSEWRDAAANSTNRLRAIRKLDAGLAELSGMTLASGPDGKIAIFGIGDKSGKLTRIELTRSGQDVVVTGQPAITDLTPLLMASLTPCDPQTPQRCPGTFRHATQQWEAISHDGSGRIFTLQETTDLIVGFAPNLERIDMLLHLDLTVPGLAKKPSSKQRKRSNSRGEGLLLLKQGHALIAMETKPAMLIEVGPAGATPLGFSSAQILGSQELFTPKTESAATSAVARGRLVALASWRLERQNQACDAADLALDDKGRLLVLSQSCGQIFVIEQLAIDSMKTSIAQTLTLPANLRKAEALVQLPSGEFLVGEDLKTAKPSVHILVTTQDRAPVDGE